MGQEMCTELGVIFLSLGAFASGSQSILFFPPNLASFWSVGEEVI